MEEPTQTYTKFYMHSDKESSREVFIGTMLADGNIITPEAADNSMYAGYEVEFTGYWNCTGEFFATEVNGVALTEPVRI